MLETLVGAVVEVISEPTKLSLRQEAKVISRTSGFSRQEWECFEEIIYRESRWDPRAENGSHYGLGQMKNGKHYLKGKPKKQIRKAITYIKSKYGTACVALAHHDRKGWY